MQVPGTDPLAGERPHDGGFGQVRDQGVLENAGQVEDTADRRGRAPGPQRPGQLPSVGHVDGRGLDRHAGRPEPGQILVGVAGGRAPAEQQQVPCAHAGEPPRHPPAQRAQAAADDVGPVGAHPGGRRCGIRSGQAVNGCGEHRGEQRAAADHGLARRFPGPQQRAQRVQAGAHGAGVDLDLDRGAPGLEVLVGQYPGQPGPGRVEQPVGPAAGRGHPQPGSAGRPFPPDDRVGQPQRVDPPGGDGGRVELVLSRVGAVTGSPSVHHTA